jgi:hypothetical protein
MARKKDDEPLVPFEPIPPKEIVLCRNCHKPMGEDGCGINGKGETYCVPVESKVE